MYKFYIGIISLLFSSLVFGAGISKDLIEAIHGGDFQKTKTILEQGTDPNFTYEYSELVRSEKFKDCKCSDQNPNWPYATISTTPLITAIEFGLEDIVKLLLDHQASVLLTSGRGAANACDQWKASQYRAIIKNHLKIYKMLGQKDPRPFPDRTDLIFAARFVDWNFFHFIYENAKIGIDDLINTHSLKMAFSYFPGPEEPGIFWTEISKSTPLFAAARYGRSEIVAKLLALGADPNFRVLNRGFTPLMAAAFSGDFYSVEHLLKAGARVDDELSGPNFPEWGVETALFSSLIGGNSEIVCRLLRENKLDANKANSVGMLPLFFAASNRLIKAASCLLEKSTDPNGQSRFNGNYAIFPAVGMRISISYGYQGDEEILRALIAKGAKVNVVESDNKRTPLHEAVHACKLWAIKQLVNHPDIDKTMKTRDGQTALDLAKNYCPQAVPLLQYQKNFQEFKYAKRSHR